MMCEQIEQAWTKSLSEVPARLAEAVAQGVGSEVLRSDISRYASTLRKVEQADWYPNTLYARMTPFAKMMSGRNIYGHTDGVIIHCQTDTDLVFSVEYTYMLARLQRAALDKKAAFIHIPPSVLPEDVVGYVVKALLANQRYVDVTKIFSFAYGHQLHSNLLSEEQNGKIFGPCYRMHGHNMELHITVRGWANPLTGMVINFTDLKKIVNDTLAWLDHGFLNNLIVDVPTTCENVAPILWSQLMCKLPNLQKIRVFETNTSYCDIER